MSSDWGILLQQELGVSPRPGRSDDPSASRGSGFDLKLRPRARFEPAGAPSGTLEALASETVAPPASSPTDPERKASPHRSGEEARPDLTAKRDPPRRIADRDEGREATRENTTRNVDSPAQDHDRAAAAQAGILAGEDSSADARDLAALAQVTVVPLHDETANPSSVLVQPRTPRATSDRREDSRDTSAIAPRPLSDSFRGDRDRDPRPAPSPAAELGIAIDAAAGPRASPPPPRVQVTIGSIELRLEGPRTAGTSSPANASQPRTAPRPRAATTSLQDYLHGAPPGAVRP